jgi:choline dehydrogenase
VLQWAFFGTGPFASQVTSAAMMVRTSPDLTRPDIQLMFLPIRLDGKIWFPGMGQKKEDLFSIMIIQLHPESRGSVELRSADPREKPKIRLNLLSAARDYAELRRGIEAVRSVFAAKPVSDLVTRETKPGADKTSDAALDEFIRQNLQITQHPVGTCSMGSGASAVVDPSLRVIGVEGLRVADASIMPTVPGGNTNAPVIMIAEKAADLIREQRPSPQRAAERMTA